MEESDNSISSSGTNDADSHVASELSLSCLFSSFEGENPDPVESSHEDTGSEIIEPYSFEPTASGEDSPSSPPEEYESEPSRLDSIDW